MKNISATGTLGVTGDSTLKKLNATTLGVSGNTTLTGTLGVTGDTTVNNLTVSGAFVNNSSREVKTNIHPLEHRDAFDRIQPVSFRYKYSEETDFGFIYEDMKDLYPETCYESRQGDKGISYLDFVAVLVKEVQQLRQRVAELEKERK